MLYDCDILETYTSMNVNQPIAVTFNEEELVPMLIRDLKETAKSFSEKNKTLYESLKNKDLDSKNKDVFENILDAYKQSKVNYRSLITLYQGYEAN